MDSLRFGSCKDFSLGWWNARSCMKSHERTFTKVDKAVHDNIFEVLIAGSLSNLYSWLPIALFYLHRGTSLIGRYWHVSWGGRPLACHFANTSAEMAKFVRSALKTLFYLPWIQAALILIFVIAAASAAVTWAVCQVDFADYTSISTDYIPPLLTNYGVYNAVKCLARINNCDSYEL